MALAQWLALAFLLTGFAGGVALVVWGLLDDGDDGSDDGRGWGGPGDDPVPDPSPGPPARELAASYR